MSKNPPFLRRLWSALPFVKDSRPLVTVLELSGVIGVSSGLGDRGLSHAKVEKVIAAAFQPKDLSAVALAINSPGGSPVQSHLIMRAIRRAAEKAKVPVLAFIEDAGASGGYMLALAGDEIYADEASIVGSIGVISAGFGFTTAIDRLGIERRVYTAGESKSQLDPFRPENDADIAKLDTILTEMHAHFIGLVKERRGTALNDAFDDLFTGAFWTAGPAHERGLIDGIGRLDEFLQTRFGETVRIKRIFRRSTPFRRLFGARRALSPMPGQIMGASDEPLVDLAGGLADGLADGVFSALEERAFWARIGL
ncbi:MAG: S49 family peptidase [Pseudomonadota bacterium]